MTITAGSQKWGSREREWKPIIHDVPERHAGCDGEIEDDYRFDDGPNQPPIIWRRCKSCRKTLADSEVVPYTSCDGHKFPIR